MPQWDTGLGQKRKNAGKVLLHDCEYRCVPQIGAPSTSLWRTTQTYMLQGAYNQTVLHLLVLKIVSPSPKVYVCTWSRTGHNVGLEQTLRKFNTKYFDTWHLEKNTTGIHPIYFLPKRARVMAAATEWCAKSAMGFLFIYAESSIRDDCTPEAEQPASYSECPLSVAHCPLPMA